MFGQKKEKSGDILRWARKNMEPSEFQLLIDAKDKDPDAFMNSIENLKKIKAQMEGKTEPKQQQKKRKTKKVVDVKSKTKQRKSEIFSSIATKRKKFREYTKVIVPLEAAEEAEDKKLQVMSTDIQLATKKVLDIGNKEEQMLERAKYVCKNYPKALVKAKTLLDACANEAEKQEIQRDYDEMMRELNEMRALKSALDGYFAKAKEGAKVIFRTLFMGSANRTLLQEVKLNTGGY